MLQAPQKTKPTNKKKPKHPNQKKPTTQPKPKPNKTPPINQNPETEQKTTRGSFRNLRAIELVIPIRQGKEKS